MDLQPNSATETQMLKMIKKQLFWQRLICLLMAGVIGGGILLAVRIAPRLQELGSLVEQTKTALTELEDVSKRLGELDMEGLLNDTDQMVRQGEKSFSDMSESVSSALKNLEDLDVESFNQAIGRLNSITGRLTSIFGG